MASVKLTLQAENQERAAEIAAAIREAGTLQYTNVEGNTVNVTVGDVEASA